MLLCPRCDSEVVNKRIGDETYLVCPACGFSSGDDRDFKEVITGDHSGSLKNNQ